MRAAPSTSVRSAPLEASLYSGARWGCCLHERRPAFCGSRSLGSFEQCCPCLAQRSRRAGGCFCALRPRLSAALRLTPRPLGRRFVPGAMTRVVFPTFPRVGNSQSRAAPEGTRTTVWQNRTSAKGASHTLISQPSNPGLRNSASLRRPADGARRLRSRRRINKAKRPPEDNEA